MPEALSISAPPAQKRIAIFLDGTWNSVGDNTNVWRLKSLCSKAAPDGRAQTVYYDIGVNGVWGGMLGKGLSDNIADAYKWLVDEYEIGDEIFIFGFSRGAYTARSLAGFIAKCGLLQRGAALSVNQLFSRYKRAGDRTIWKLREQCANGTLGECTLEEHWMLKYSQAINIKLLGVWDTVGALGVPAFHIEGISRATLGFLHTGLRLPIENGYHALAVDEHRKAFSPTLWTTRMPKDPTAVVAAPRPITGVEQRWFVGAHANVGGGCQSDLLAQIPLRWIMKKASQHGLAFRNDIDIDGDAISAQISDSHREFMRGAYSKFSRKQHRRIGAPPDEGADGTHSTVNETVDVSVFDRWRAVASYRPEGLAEWAERRGVKAEEVRTSVLADQTAEPAPD